MKKIVLCLMMMLAGLSYVSAQAKADMSRMLDYIDQLNELDTSGVEPMTHIFPVNNVFREDEEKDEWSREEILENAPKQKDGFFQVPKTVE